MKQQSQLRCLGRLLFGNQLAWLGITLQQAQAQTAVVALWVVSPVPQSSSLAGVAMQ